MRQKTFWQHQNIIIYHHISTELDINSLPIGQRSLDEKIWSTKFFDGLEALSEIWRPAMFRRWKGNDFSMRRLKCLNLQARQEMSSTVDLVDIGGIGYGRRRQWTPDSPFAAVCTYASRIATEKSRRLQWQRCRGSVSNRTLGCHSLQTFWLTYRLLNTYHILILYLYIWYVT